MQRTSTAGNVEDPYVDHIYEDDCTNQVHPDQDEEGKEKTYVPNDVQTLSKANSDVAPF